MLRFLRVKPIVSLGGLTMQWIILVCLNFLLGNAVFYGFLNQKNNNPNTSISKQYEKEIKKEVSYLEVRVD